MVDLEAKSGVTSGGVADAQNIVPGARISKRPVGFVLSHEDSQRILLVDAYSAVQRGLRAESDGERQSRRKHHVRIAGKAIGSNTYRGCHPVIWIERCAYIGTGLPQFVTEVDVEAVHSVSIWVGKAAEMEIVVGQSLFGVETEFEPEAVT